MTLSEALDTMKPYRRRGQASWRPKINTSDMFTVFEAIATDYEIEEPSVSVTITQLRLAVLKVSPGSADHHIVAVAKELGL